MTCIFFLKFKIKIAKCSFFFYVNIEWSVWLTIKKLRAMMKVQLPNGMIPRGWGSIYGDFGRGRKWVVSLSVKVMSFS